MDGVDYLVSYSRAARMTEAGPVPVVELPDGINNQGMTLVSGEVMVPCNGGVFYRLPLDPDGWQHVVPATMGYMQREDYDGKTGETIYVKYPVMMVDGPYYYEGLYHAMTEYNDQVLDQAEALSAECMNKVSEQIDNGFTDPEDFYTATVDVYIQRSDVTAFSFLEHQWINTTLSRTDVDLWTGYNFNTKDGSMLSLKDVVTDIGKLKDVMVSLTDSTHRAFFDEILTGDLVSRPACSWVLGYEGLTFWFNPQVNYTYGGVPVSVFIPFADYPELFTDSVTCVPRDYAYDVVVEDYWSHPLTLSCDEGSLSVRPSARKNSDIGVYDKLQRVQRRSVLRLPLRLDHPHRQRGAGLRQGAAERTELSGPADHRRRHGAVYLQARSRGRRGLLPLLRHKRADPSDAPGPRFRGHAVHLSQLVRQSQLLHHGGGSERRQRLL